MSAWFGPALLAGGHGSEPNLYLSPLLHLLRGRLAKVLTASWNTCVNENIPNTLGAEEKGKAPVVVTSSVLLFCVCAVPLCLIPWQYESPLSSGSFCYLLYLVEESQWRSGNWVSTPCCHL